jgi:hypothetical protein
MKPQLDDTNFLTEKQQIKETRGWHITQKCITNDARCKREIKSRIGMAKTAIHKKKNLFTSKLDLNLRKKLVKCYIWSIALDGAETWTFRDVDQKYLESFEMWCWRRLEKISWTDRVRNEEVLHSQGQEYPTYNKKKKG